MNEDTVTPVTLDGHDIFIGSNRILGNNPLPSYYFYITLQFQEHPGVIGYATRAGLIVPRQGSWTGEWTGALMAHLYTTLPTYRPGMKTPSGFPIMVHIAPSEQYYEGPPDHLVDEEPGSWDDED